MSDNDDDKKAGNQPPENTPPPPPPPVKLPPPDGLADINRASNLAREKAKAEKKSKKKKERRHPKDPYKGQLKEARSCGCGALLLILVVLLALPVGGVYLWFNKLQTEYTANQGFAFVRVQEKNVTEAPAEKTVYLGSRVLYEVPETRQEVVFMGGIWWLSGTFHEKVTFHGAQLVLEPGSKFLKGLEVQAIRLDLGDAVIEGEVTGKILQQTAGGG